MVLNKHGVELGYWMCSLGIGDKVANERHWRSEITDFQGKSVVPMLAFPDGLHDLCNDTTYCHKVPYAANTSLGSRLSTP